MALVSKNFSDIITFSRTSGATWFNSVGVLQGVDFSVTSNTIGTGSKTFTLDATGGVDRYWTAGDTVLISDQANSANNMVGTVTSYNASTQVLVCNITSTGGSGTITSWRIGSTMPRFDYDPSTLAARGFLIEEQRTNVCLQSAALNTTPWSVVSGNSSINANTTIAPDGTTTGDSLIPDATPGVAHLVTQPAIGGLDRATQRAISVFVKLAGYQGIRIQDNAFSSNFTRAFFNLSTLTSSTSQSGNGVASNATITNVGNGWYRCSYISTPNTVTGGGSDLTIAVVDTGFNDIFAGDGTSGVVLWGCQVEAGAFPTSYIPTTTTALTRSADVASVNTLSPWFNATEGTLYGEITDAAITVSGTSRRIANINDGTEADRITVGWAGATSVAAAFVTDNSVAQASFTSSSGAYPFPTKVALAYKAADFQAAVNGSAFAAVSSGTVPTVNRMTIGDVVTGGTGPQNINGHIRRITYYPRKLSSAELQAITA